MLEPAGRSLPPARASADPPCPPLRRPTVREVSSWPAEARDSRAGYGHAGGEAGTNALSHERIRRWKVAGLAALQDSRAGVVWRLANELDVDYRKTASSNLP